MVRIKYKYTLEDKMNNEKRNGSEKRKAVTPRKKEIINLIIAFFIMGSISLVVAIVGFAVVSPIMGLIGLIILLGVPVATFYEYRNVNLSYCRKCGEKYDYDCDVEWNVVDVKCEEKKEETIVSISCTCHNCGVERSFERKYITATIDDKGNEKIKPIEPQIKRCFKKK